MTKFIALAFVSSALFTACTTSSGSDMTIDPTPLAGTVSGLPWSLDAAATDAFLSENSTTYFANFYATAYKCGDIEPSGPALIVAVPKQTGDYPMNLGQSMTFVNGSDNKIAIDGRVEVDTVSATTLTGGLVGSYDDSNTVSGQFTLTICPTE
jgi:hypothetical protein